MEQEERDLILNHELSEIGQKISNIMRRNEALKRKVKRLESVSKDQQSHVLKESCKFLSTKSGEYKDSIKKLKKHLKCRGYDPSLSHGRLVIKREKVQELEEKLNQITSQLGTYQDLPADEKVAKFKIEEAKKELTQVQKDIDALLFNIC
ncbi:uncharacterized protein LOC129228034 [Uloborus diversus]|uniref:uncharacterized protein LOC129228034 n=1 Tax=Uloborus diversus TaxID=327109 RepID=UPI002409613B|nr:uncharacterized protein LOC129228034 [Uloborus diversus]